MARQVQLHLTAPLPSWTQPGTPLSRRPAAADVRTPPAEQVDDFVAALKPGDPASVSSYAATSDEGHLWLYAPSSAHCPGAAATPSAAGATTLAALLAEWLDDTDAA
jgi:hypothetical protein